MKYKIGDKVVLRHNSRYRKPSYQEEGFELPVSMVGTICKIVEPNMGWPYMVEWIRESGERRFTMYNAQNIILAAALPLEELV